MSRIILAALTGALLTAAAAAAAGPKFQTIFQLGANEFPGPVTAAPGGDVYGGDFSGEYQLTPPTQPGGSWTRRYLHLPESGPLLPSPNGGLYAPGGSSNGAIYLISPPSSPGGRWTQSAIHTFTGTPDGSLPFGNLILNQDGSLYGVTGEGGLYGFGTVYQLSPPSAPGRRVDRNHPHIALPDRPATAGFPKIWRQAAAVSSMAQPPTAGLEPVRAAAAESSSS
jgi:uncharacterized repeat protein (TIGR03803 family)